MTTRGTVVFDIIGTCFSLEKPRQRLVELGAPTYALDLWFAQTLRDAFALSHAGGYRPLKQVLEAELPRTMKVLGIDLDTIQLSHVVASFAELELQPGALEAFQILTEAGWQLIALTNGSEDSTHKYCSVPMRSHTLLASFPVTLLARRSRTLMSTLCPSEILRAMCGWLLPMLGTLLVLPALA